MSAADRSLRGWIEGGSRGRGGRAPLRSPPEGRSRTAGVACLTCLAAACKVGMRHRSTTASLCRPVRPSQVAGGPDTRERLIRWSSTWL